MSKPCYVEYIHYEHANLTPYTLVGEIVPKEAGKPTYRSWVLLENCRTYTEAVTKAHTMCGVVRKGFYPQDIHMLPQEILY